MQLADWLRCPHCHGELSHDGAALRCPSRHSFDVARQGYVNLLGRAAPHNADTPGMLEARARFLGTGLFDPVADAVAEPLRGRHRLVEVGAGTAYYLAHALDRHPAAQGLATDVSVPAAKRAARAHERAHAVVADTWAGLPVRDGVADALLCVFAPRNPSEFERLVAPGGVVVVAVPTVNHLRELRAAHGLLDVAEDKAATVAAAFSGWRSTAWTVEYPAHLDGPQATDLVAMGPNAFHDRPRIVDDISVTVSVTVVTLQRQAP